LLLSQVSLLTPVDLFTARFRALYTFIGEPLGIEMVGTDTLATFYAASRWACSRSMACRFSKPRAFHLCLEAFRYRAYRYSSQIAHLTSSGIRRQ
jgi:hypothetical protein